MDTVSKEIHYSVSLSNMRAIRHHAFVFPIMDFSIMNNDDDDDDDDY